jgi:hypothetical protein
MRLASLQRIAAKNWRNAERALLALVAGVLLALAGCERRPLQDPFDAACRYGRACPWCDTCADGPRK